jgi:hypothetical protein
MPPRVGCLIAVREDHHIGQPEECPLRPDTSVNDFVGLLCLAGSRAAVASAGMRPLHAPLWEELC